MTKQGLTVEQVQKVFDDFMQSFNGNIDVLPHIKSRQEELYGPNATIEKLGFPIQGAYHPASRFITLAAANLDNEEVARRTIRHELLGHYALNTFTPAQKRDLLTSILETQQEPTLKPIWDKVNKNYADKGPSARAEEVFAFVAEDEGSFASRAWDKVRATFQKALRACRLSKRPLTIHELRVEAQIIADGIRRGERVQQTFPAHDNAQFRIEDSPMENSKKPFAEQVAENLIKQLEAGTAPWQKPWEPGREHGMLPMNPTTGNRYKGINAIHLMAQGHDDNRWLTYNQAKDVGAQVRKGESGTTVQYWKFSEERTKEDEQGKPVLDGNGKPVKETVKLERPRVFHATVFNAEQIDGLPAYVKPESKEQQWTPLERAEHILEASGAKIRHDGGNRAFYRPSTDSIHMPDRSQFQTADNYYATALHELGHWTGHGSRLGRDLENPFGSEGYAKEELRAEIASMILGEELAIGHDPEQHAAYVGSWIKALKEDPLEIFRAAADAEKIQSFVLAFEQQRLNELQEAQTVTQVAEQTHENLLSRIHAADKDHIEGYSPLGTWENLSKVAEENGYKAMLTAGEESDVVITYRNDDGLIPVTTEMWIGDGKAATSVSGDSVPGTGMTSDLDWQRDALMSAFNQVQRQEQATAELAQGLAKLEADHASTVLKLQKSDDKALSNAWLAITATAESKGVTPLLSPASDGYIAQYEHDGKLLPVTTVVSKDSVTMVDSLLSELKVVLSETLNQRTELETALASLQPTLRQLAREEALFADEQAGDWVVETIDGKELCSTFHHEDDAKAEAKRIGDLATAFVLVKQDVMTQAEFDDVSRKTLGHDATFFEPQHWTGFITSRYLAEFTDNKGEKFIEEVPLNEAEFVGLYAGHSDDRIMHVADFTNPAELDAMRSRLEGVKIQLTTLENHLPILKTVVADSDQEQTGLPPMNQPLKQEQGRTYINVPFKEKNEAKELGAKWDNTQVRSWYVPDGVDVAPFAKWMTNNAQADTPTKPEASAQPVAADRVYLAVPYAERAAAKAAGAKWDKNASSWYADENTDLKQLRQYLVENNTKTGPSLTPREELADALRSLGAIVDGEHPIMDGKTHRITVEGDKPSEKSGFYVAHADQHPAGYIKNNRTSLDMKWKSKGYTLSDEERATMQAEAAGKLAERAKAEALQHSNVSNALTMLYMAAPDAPHDATYLQSKGVDGHGIKIVPEQLAIATEPQILIGRNFGESKALRANNPDALVFTAGELLVPAQDTNGTIWQMQAIQANGSKRFASGGKKEGSFFVVDGLQSLDDAPVIMIGEGYATAKTLSEAAGMATVAAFDSGNLEKVALTMRERYPDKPIIIAGDDDVHLATKAPYINVGRQKATAAAAASGGVAVFPIFAPGESDGSQDKKALTDFNDLGQQSVLGKDGLQRQVKAVVNSMARQLAQQRELAKQQDQEQQQTVEVKRRRTV